LANLFDLVVRERQATGNAKSASGDALRDRTTVLFENSHSLKYWLLVYGPKKVSCLLQVQPATSSFIANRKVSASTEARFPSGLQQLPIYRAHSALARDELIKSPRLREAQRRLQATPSANSIRVPHGQNAWLTENIGCVGYDSARPAFHHQ
jgi:hypothetical protein